MIAREQELEVSVNHPGVQISVPVPLPTEIPPIPNLSQLPSHILHSGTVETLIGQNEDLMARLKVNIRRNSVLEQQIMEQDRVNQDLARINNSIVAQLQVFQEKERIVKEKNDSFDQKLDALRDENTLLHERLEAADERREELHAGLRFEASFRRRVRKWVRPFINKMQEERVHLETRVKFLDRQLSAREAAVGDLRAKLHETITQLQDVSRRSQGDQALIVERYEVQIKDLDAELLKIKTEFKLAAEKASRVELAISAKTEAENRIVYLERKNKELESKLGAELSQFQDQIVSFRKEAKALAAELVDTKAQLAQANEARANTEEELRILKDQYESLQIVWAESQKKLETARTSQDSLGKLNQELSRQLQDERKRREEPAVTQASEARLERIDSLLAEIESGFVKAKTESKNLEGKLGNLDILEDEAKFSEREANL